jgi:zinc/manganese transport system substrate-binding protein
MPVMPGLTNGGKSARWPTVFAFVVALALTSGCAGNVETGVQASYLPGVTILAIDRLAPIEIGEGDKLQVVVTTSLLGEAAAAVAGDAADVTELIPRGADPHEYQPAPRDGVALAQADIILTVGLGYETFLGDLISGAGVDVPVVTLSQGIEPLPIGGAPANGSPLTPGEIDPHVWLDPQSVVAWARNAAAAFSALDPAHAQDYHANADGYIGKLEELDAWADEQIRGLSSDRRNVATGHAVMGYMAHRYGLNVVGAIQPAGSDLGEPSARELADLEDQLREQHVGAIFVGIYDNHSLADQVGRDTGIPVIPLYLESLSQMGGPAGTYQDLIRYDVNAIVEALK